MAYVLKVKFHFIFQVILDIRLFPSQAKLNEIITAGATAVHSTGSSEKPWMVDGAGVSSNASELLPRLVKLIQNYCYELRTHSFMNLADLCWIIFFYPHSTLPCL